MVLDITAPNTKLKDCEEFQSVNNELSSVEVIPTKKSYLPEQERSKCSLKWKNWTLCIVGVILFIVGVTICILWYVGVFKKRDFEAQLDADDTETLYTMLRDADLVFNKHNIRYWTAYGTLLGQIRHGGVIPWDDDGDFHVDSRDIPKMVGNPDFLLDLKKMNYGFYTNKQHGFMRIYPLNGKKWTEKFGEKHIADSMYESYWRHPFLDLFIMKTDDMSDLEARFYNNENFDPPKLKRKNIYPLQRKEFATAMESNDKLKIKAFKANNEFTLNAPHQPKHVLQDYFGENCLAYIKTSWANFDGMSKGAINQTRRIEASDQVPLGWENENSLLKYNTLQARILLQN